MACVNRSHNGSETDCALETGSPYMAMFESFRTELDEHHDRRERVIKHSRDITASSKKLIFALQRVKMSSLGEAAPESSFRSKEYSQHLSIIQDRLASVIPDLSGINAYRYQRQISPGIQEFVEAVLFQHFLETQTLLPHQACAEKLPPSIPLTDDDYTLGLFDMSGELMRYAISQLATGGGQALVPSVGSEVSILGVMQSLRAELEALDGRGSFNLAREIDRKMITTKASVEKVEMVMYSMTVRGRERPKGWNPALEVTRPLDEVNG